MSLRSLTPFSPFSRTLVRLVSISAALAPGYADITMMTLASKSGNCAIEVFMNENTPKMANATKSNVVVTGLFTAVLYILIIVFPYYYCTFTFTPSLRLPCPLTTMVSPSLRPLRIS